MSAKVAGADHAGGARRRRNVRRQAEPERRPAAAASERAALSRVIGEELRQEAEAVLADAEAGRKSASDSGPERQESWAGSYQKGRAAAGAGTRVCGTDFHIGAGRKGSESGLRASRATPTSAPSTVEGDAGERRDHQRVEEPDQERLGVAVLALEWDQRLADAEARRLREESEAGRMERCARLSSRIIARIGDERGDRGEDRDLLRDRALRGSLCPRLDDIFAGPSLSLRHARG